LSLVSAFGEVVEEVVHFYSWVEKFHKFIQLERWRPASNSSKALVTVEFLRLGTGIIVLWIRVIVAILDNKKTCL